jgi:hypothetical protein
MRNWKILEWGEVPETSTTTVPYDCQMCGEAALLPVLGRAVAQLAGGGLVFEPGAFGIPKVVKCPHCRRSFTTDAEPEPEKGEA